MSTTYHPDTVTFLETYKVNVNTGDMFFNHNSGDGNELAHSFLMGLHILANVSRTPIRIWINSEGGSVPDYMTMYDAIKMYPYNVTTIISGSAQSMGVVLAQAGNVRLITPNSYMMYHAGSAPKRGDDEYLS